MKHLIHMFGMGCRGWKCGRVPLVDGNSFQKPNVVCGNGVKEESEECDGADVGEATCVSLGFYGGTLQCTNECHWILQDVTDGVGWDCTSTSRGTV